MQLLQNAGNGTGTPNENMRPDQFFTVYAWGAFVGAVVGVDISFDGVNWFSTGIALTAPGVQNVEFRAKQIRGNVTGGGGGVSINLEIV